MLELFEKGRRVCEVMHGWCHTLAMPPGNVLPRQIIPLSPENSHFCNIPAAGISSLHSPSAIRKV